MNLRGALERQAQALFGLLEKAGIASTDFDRGCQEITMRILL